MKDNASLYLARYAEPEARRASSAARTYRHVLSIPAFDETGDFLQRVLPRGAADLLVILVANVPDHVKREETAFARTRDLLDLAGALDRARNVDVAIVDRVNGSRSRSSARRTPIPRCLRDISRRPRGGRRVGSIRLSTRAATKISRAEG